MSKTMPASILAMLSVACATPNAPPLAVPIAQEPASAEPRKTEVTVPIGLGFTDDPDTLLLAGAVDFPFQDHWTIGPALQVGLDDDFTLLAPTLQAKRFFPLEGEASRLLPFVTGGAGIAYLDTDRGGGDDDTGFLLAVGGGARYLLTERISLGTQAQLNFVPGEVLDESFYFSWELVQVVLRF